MRALLLCLSLAAPLTAQLPGDPGPHLVGWQDVAFDHPLAQNSPVFARIYYPASAAGEATPATPEAGPFPIAGFLHGYFAPATFYNILSSHVASWGFVVAAVNTESGFFQNIDAQAADAYAMLHWADAQSADPSSFLAGMLEPDGWVVYGHSNGAAGIFNFVNGEPRIAAIALSEPNWLGNPAVSSMDLPVLVVGSSNDVVAPNLLNASTYYSNLTATPRKTYTVIDGGGHNGSLDFPSAINPLSHAEQNRLHRKLIGAFLRAERFDQEDLYVHLSGESAAAEPIDLITSCDDPPLWVTDSQTLPGAVNFCISAHEQDLAVVVLSLLPASLPTPFGLLGIDLSASITVLSAPLGITAVGEAQVPVPPGVSGIPILVQGLALGTQVGVLTRVATYTLP